MAVVPSTALPGAVLGPTTGYAPGAGTHVHNGQVISSLMGHVTVTPSKTPAGPAKRLNKLTSKDSSSASLATISVARHGRRREVLPDVGNVVLARVLRLMPRQAIVVIQQVGETVLQTEWQGVIRVQDVRATEKDKVKVYESFKPGDIVKAQVVRLADFYHSVERVWLTLYRSPWVTRPTTTFLRRRTSWASSWPQARPETTWFPSAGRSTGTLRLEPLSCERLRSQLELERLIISQQNRYDEGSPMRRQARLALRRPVIQTSSPAGGYEDQLLLMCSLGLP